MHIEKFQTHFGTSSITGKLLQVSMETAQLEVGVGRNLFQLDFDTYGDLLTDCWIKTLWKFCQSNNITLLDRHSHFPTPQQENDVFLMEIFVHEGYSKAKLAKINRCRLYLGALTLSDVMNGYGNGFTTAYQCNRDTTQQSLPTRLDFCFIS